MKPLFISLDKVKFTINDSVGRNIIIRAIKNQSKNSIRKANNVFFKSYTKFWSIVNNDSVAYIEYPKNYRDSSLTNKDKNTYNKMGSIGLKYKLEKQLKLFRFVNTGGKLPIGKVDLDLRNIAGYNDYEGFHLGAVFSTNERLSDKYSLNAYFAYGFQDKKLKFGVGGEYYINKLYSGKIFASYKQDVSPSGKFPILLQSNYTSFVSNAFSNIYNNKYFSYKTYTFGYQQDFFQNLTFNLSLNY